MSVAAGEAGAASSAVGPGAEEALVDILEEEMEVTSVTLATTCTEEEVLEEGAEEDEAEEEVVAVVEVSPSLVVPTTFTTTTESFSKCSNLCIYSIFVYGYLTLVYIIGIISECLTMAEGNRPNTNYTSEAALEQMDGIIQEENCLGLKMKLVLAACLLLSLINGLEL